MKRVDEEKGGDILRVDMRYADQNIKGAKRMATRKQAIKEAEWLNRLYKGNKIILVVNDVPAIYGGYATEIYNSVHDIAVPTTAISYIAGKMGNHILANILG